MLKYKKYGFKKTSNLPLHVEHVKFYQQQVSFNYLSKNSQTTHKCNIVFFYSSMTQITPQYIRTKNKCIVKRLDKSGEAFWS